MDMFGPLQRRVSTVHMSDLLLLDTLNEQGRFPCHTLLEHARLHPSPTTWLSFMVDRQTFWPLSYFSLFQDRWQPFAVPQAWNTWRPTSTILKQPSETSMLFLLQTHQTSKWIVKQAISPFASFPDVSHRDKQCHTIPQYCWNFRRCNTLLLSEPLFDGELTNYAFAPTKQGKLLDCAVKSIRQFSSWDAKVQPKHAIFVDCWSKQFKTASHLQASLDLNFSRNSPVLLRSAEPLRKLSEITIMELTVRSQPTRIRFHMTIRISQICSASWAHENDDIFLQHLHKHAKKNHSKQNTPLANCSNASGRATILYTSYFGVDSNNRTTP